MSKKSALSLLLAAVILFGATLAVSHFATLSREANAAAEISSSTPVGEPLYVIRDYWGKIAIFEKDGVSPMRILDTYTSTLPAFDRAELEAGIAISSQEELWQRIEDYTS